MRRRGEGEWERERVWGGEMHSSFDFKQTFKCVSPFPYLRGLQGHPSGGGDHCQGNEPLRCQTLLPGQQPAELSGVTLTHNVSCSVLCSVMFALRLTFVLCYFY